jgi:hypothetical protein
MYGSRGCTGHPGRVNLFTDPLRQTELGFENEGSVLETLMNTAD